MSHVLTRDIPRVLNTIDLGLTRGVFGRLCGYIFSPKTPLIMVCSWQATSVDADYISLFDDWRDIYLLLDNMETYPWSSGIANP